MAAAVDEQCLDDDTAAAFVDLGLAGDRRHQVEAHLDRCAACRVHVAALARNDSDAARDVEIADDILRPGAMLGRYRLERRLGAGGMGVVWLARDPQLDRPVALKLPRRASLHSPPAARAILREARALARLSDPRIVEIYDVAEDGGRSYIAMRYIDGLPLDQWAAARRPTGWREILRACIHAGHGLAAAHRAGLLHRDVKPSNIMVGATGEAFITDFGLSRFLAEPADERGVSPSHDDPLQSSRTRSGALIGTVLYMAPEQHGGVAVEASDQYAFCVSLFEALYGERPFRGDDIDALLEAKQRPPERPPAGHEVPSWLHAVLLRGLAAEPQRRWPTMDALLTALGRGRARVGPKHVLAACGLIGIAIASVGGLHSLDIRERTHACEAAAAEIDEVWNDATRTQVHDALLATGVGYAATTAEKVTPWLDAQASAWAQARTEVCLNHDVRGTLEATTIDRALWCLDQRRVELEALTTELATANAITAQHAVTAAARLSSVAACSDADLLARQLPPPPIEQREAIRALRMQLFRAKAHERAEAYDEALEEARSVGHAAADLRSPQLLFAARAAETRMLSQRGALEDAERAGSEAYYGAVGLGDWDTAAEVGTALVWIVGYHQARRREGDDWARHAKAALTQVRDPEGLRAAELASNVALVAHEHGEYTRAREGYERTIAIREHALVADHPDIAKALGDLARLLIEIGDHAGAAPLLERALAIHERTFGPTHPDVGHALIDLATLHLRTGGHARARPLFIRAIEIREKAFGSDSIQVAEAIQNLAVLDLETGDHASAGRLLERALTISEKSRGPDHPRVAVILDNLAAVHSANRDYAQACALRERALAIQEEALGPDHPGVGRTLQLLANVYRSQGDHVRTRAMLERALAISTKAFGPEHAEVAIIVNGLAIEDQVAGDYASARERFERSVAVLERARGPDDPAVTQALSNYARLLLAVGDHAKSQALHERVLATREALGRDRPDVAITLTHLAELHVERGLSDDALPLVERAVAIFDRIEGVQVGELAARFRLARVLVDTGGDRERARELATQARDGWRAAGEASAKDLSRVETWLRGIDGSRRGGHAHAHP